MRKYTEVDFTLCDPRACGVRDGTCVAVRACTHRLLEQEDPFEPPVLLSSSMCSGCAQCVHECPLGALRITGGL